MTPSDLAYLAADTLPAWRPLAIMALVALVVALAHLVAAAWGEG